MNRSRHVARGPRSFLSRRGRWRAAALCLAGAVVGALTQAPATGAEGAEPAPVACPSALAEKATCYTGRDTNGAYYAIAIPEDWNKSLVVHAHGGPDLGDGSDPERSIGDLERWQVMVDQGYAWAGSSYRRGGYGTRMAAADTENLRRLFTEEFGRPQRTYVHGQSWGGNVAAKVVETYGGASGPYDGALLTNGVLGGGSRGYDYRVDLRVVYQYYCANLPRPSEPQYPLWQGLRPASTLTTTGMRARLQECTGYASPPEERTALQQRNLDDILAVTRIPERTLESHLRFSVFTFRDIVHKRLGDRNPFTNEGVRYSGSHDDEALNAGVERFTADPTAVRDLSYDSDLTGKVKIPVLTLHAIDDPTAFIEHEAAYRDTLTGAHRDAHLVQTFTHEHEHSALSDSEYANSIASLDRWVRTGDKPTPRSIAASCATFDRTYATGCFYDPAYRPSSYASRVRPRPGGTTWPAMTAAQEKSWSRVEGVGIAP
ncbi:alpha/beta hydrolase family protein [Streptomyces griseoloalbus]|uniref:Dienelactone hydrolase n=1 Tax=Streptomyces griseoloalbus TaxID=67303 RepID=A0A7W8F9Y2_9ACTN|nr:dienelactone hydrolase [Streptomyces albaduncus]GGW47086.1 alpha/beta hydrolase [Streptomyces albaduncus]